MAQIIRLVEQDQQSKSDKENLADKAAGWLFHVASGVAVIAYPHALGLAVATPLEEGGCAATVV